MVSALFLDVCGFTALSERLDPEIVTEVLNRLFRHVEAAVLRYDGYVDKFIGDAALALFGAPRAHEDDPERAVRAALDVFAALPALRSELERELDLSLELELHASIGTGLVVAGVLGAGEAARYSALGDPLNVAARLLGEAGPGELLISPESEERLRGRVRLEPRGTLQLRGRAAPVPAWRVLGLSPEAQGGRSASGFQSPLIGRARELADLRAALDRLTEGRGGLVSVVAQAGVGKSRLAREALAVEGPPNQPWALHVGRCISFGSTIPFHPWSDLLGGLLADPGLEPALAERTAEQLTLREALVPLREERREDPGQDSQARRGAAIDALLALLARAARLRPRVIALDDLHWADDSSLELLRRALPLARELPLLFLLLSRPEGGGEEEQRRRDLALEAELPTLDLPLLPLTPDQSRQLVDSLLGPDHGVPAEAVQRVAVRSEGVPLFVEEQLHLLRERGALVRVEGSWTLDGARAAEVERELPPNLFALLAVRIDALDERLRERLELAAVLGAELSIDDVDRALGEDEESWLRLEAEGLLSLRVGGRARFVQPMLQEAVRGMMLATRRQALHALAARSLQQSERKDQRRVHALGWHLEQAGERAQAARIWLAAAESARALDASHEALDLYDRARALDPALTDEVDTPRAALLARQGRLQEGIVVLDNLVIRLSQPHQQAAASRALSERARLAYLAGDGAGIVRFAEQALDLAQRSGDPAALGYALRSSGVGAEFCGRYAEARGLYQRLLDLLASAEGAVPELHAGLVYNSLGEIARMEGHYEAALVLYDRTLEHRRTHSAQSTRRLWNLNTGAALVGLARWREAMGRLSFALDDARRVRDRAIIPEASIYLALAQAGLGREFEALSAARAAQEEAEEQGQVEMRALSLRVIGLLEADADELPEAERALRESVDLLHGAGKAVEEARSRVALAAVLERLGVGGSQDERAQATALMSASGLAFDAEALSAVPARLVRLAVAPPRASGGQTG